MYNPIFGGRGMLSRFAQYAGFRPKAAKGKSKAKDDDDDKKSDDTDAESDSPEHGDTGEDPSDDHMESDEDDEKMESDEDDEKMSDEDEDDEDDEDKKKKFKKKGKKANRDDNDQDEDAEADEDKKEARSSRRRLRVAAFNAGRRAERARWSKIFASPLAASNLETAITLAASTSTLSAGVLAQLRKLNIAAASISRRGGNPRIGVDGSADPAPDQQTTAIQASWAKAFKPTVEAGARTPH